MRRPWPSREAVLTRIVSGLQTPALPSAEALGFVELFISRGSSGDYYGSREIDASVSGGNLEGRVRDSLSPRNGLGCSCEEGWL